MKKVLFIDRDGTLIIEPEDKQIDSFEKLAFLPAAITYLGKISKELDYQLVMVTNQDGLGTDSFPAETFWPTHNKMLQILEGEGIRFDEILIDRSFSHENSPNRKPGTGLLTHYLKGDYDLSNSYVLGDRKSDMELAKNVGAQGIFISDQKYEGVAISTMDWREIYHFLKGQDRTSYIHRKTSETDILVELNLDRRDQCEISTGLGFFDHMLEQISKHGNVGLKVKTKGDLHIDEHHTIEDTALALGAAFWEALGAKKGIQRYGFLLPMDDILAQVAIDFGGRPWMVWEAKFSREKVGDMPTEMFFHFFKSFSDTAKCNLNIKAEGNNEHHKIEAIFKAFAKAIRMAVQQTSDSSIPSTKGIL